MSQSGIALFYRPQRKPLQSILGLFLVQTGKDSVAIYDFIMKELI